MAIGSVFDARVKAELSSRLGLDQCSFELLFEEQVQEHRDEALRLGNVVYDKYVEYGGLADLEIELCGADEVQLVGKSERIVEGEGRRDGMIKSGSVKCLGYPDLSYVLNGVTVIVDWKVNGIMSAASPCKGYVKSVREKKGRVVTGIHKEVQLANGWDIALGMDWINPDWGRQLTMYHWLLGGSVGSQAKVAIDQITQRGGAYCVSRYRSRIYTEWQQQLFYDLLSADALASAGQWFGPESQDKAAGISRLYELLG